MKKQLNPPKSKEMMISVQQLVLQIVPFGAIAICDSSRESQITSESKNSPLQLCCDLTSYWNHKLRDSKPQFESCSNELPDSGDLRSPIYN